MGMLPNVFMCVLQCVGFCFTLRMAQMALVSNYVFFWETSFHFSIYCQMSRLIINTRVDIYTL